jgi:molybdate transport system substrate-binding protein
MRRTAPTPSLAAAIAPFAAAGLLLTGCDWSSTPAGTSPGSSALTSGPASLSGTVNVFAAASLKEAFTKLGRQFETAHPGVKVVFNFGPSSGLATQIGQGAPADVFASASPKNMGMVVSAGLTASSTDFASNVMQIAVPPDNPAKVTQLSDLARPAVKVALCQEAVPCGVTAAKVFTKARLTVNPASQELDVKAVLTKVTLGEVDAGVVYVTDVRAAGAKVKGIDIPGGVNASTRYPIATLTKAPNKATARAFTDYVLSADGAGVLTAAAFARP